MDKAPIGYQPGKRYVGGRHQFMDELPKKNPKYEGVKGKLDTGPTVKKMPVFSTPGWRLGDNSIAKRRSEVFFRINREGLADILSIEKNPESIYNMGQDDYDGRSLQTHQTAKTIVTTKTEVHIKMEISDKTDFVLVDLRDEAAFERYRIVDGKRLWPAINFPAVLIPRDRFPQQMYSLVGRPQQKNKPNKLIIVYHEDDKSGATFAAVLYEKGFDNVYLLTGGIEEFYQKKPAFVVGSDLPPLKSELGSRASSDKLKVVEQKPRIRKTKDELIMENELMFQKRKTGPGMLRAGSTGLSKTTADSKGFHKPQLNLDPSKIRMNSKFDDIPDGGPATHSRIMPPKPKGIKPPAKREAKEEKPLTDKLTNIAIDTKTMTSYNVERKIDRVHTDVREVTQKPNFGRYQPPQAVPPNPYV